MSESTSIFAEFKLITGELEDHHYCCEDCDIRGCDREAAYSNRADMGPGEDSCVWVLCKPCFEKHQVEPKQLTENLVRFEAEHVPDPDEHDQCYYYGCQRTIRFQTVDRECDTIHIQVCEEHQTVPFRARGAKYEDANDVGI